MEINEMHEIEISHSLLMSLKSRGGREEDLK